MDKLDLLFKKLELAEDLSDQDILDLVAWAEEQEKSPPKNLGELFQRWRVNPESNPEGAQALAELWGQARAAGLLDDQHPAESTTTSLDQPSEKI